MNKKDLPSEELLLNTFHKTISTAWNIGNKIHQTNIDKWLNNFTGDALTTDALKKPDAATLEKQLALFLLCNFVYYNENEIRYLTRVMFEKYIHCCIESEMITDVDDSKINILLKKTQFTPLGRISESSSYLLYHFRQENDLSKENFAENSSIENIVFVDDFAITGTQACIYIKDYIKKNKDKLANKKIYILLIIATENAKREFAQLNEVIILPCITMDDKSKAFSDTSIVFERFKPEYKELAKKMCEYYGRKLVDAGVSPLGFGNDGYLFGAYYNIPDNTLPIFWSNKNDWNYLFKRYNKKYFGGVSLGGRYV